MNKKKDVVEVTVSCPFCKEARGIEVPTSLFSTGENNVLISMPRNLVCAHAFQFFIDKNFKILGYQKVDFSFSRISYSNVKEWKGLDEIKRVLRFLVDGEDVIGVGMIDDKCNIIVASLPNLYLDLIMREVEFSLKGTKRMIMETDEVLLFFSRFLFNDENLNFFLIVSSDIGHAFGNFLLEQNLGKLSATSG